MGTTTSSTDPGPLLSYYEALARKGADASNLGFEAYGGSRVAPWTEQQNAAAQMIQQRAVSGSPEMAQASDWYSKMLAGQNGVGNVEAAFGPTSIANPGQIQGYNNQYMGQQAQQAQNAGQSQAGQNAYLGMDNPYLNKAIGQAQNDVTSRIDSKFNNTAFGGTAHQQTLARELGNVSNNMRMQDYAAQQGLSESDVARNLQNQQYNIGNANQMNQFNANLGAADLTRNAQLATQQGQFNSGIQGQNVANQNAANQFNANLGMSNANIANASNQFNAGTQGANINRQANAMSFAPTLAANDYADATAMMGVGNQIQQTNQATADANYQEFLRRQAYPGQQLNYMQAGLDPAKGVFGNTTSTTQTTGNPWVGALGGAATMAGGFNLFGNNTKTTG